MSDFDAEMKTKQSEFHRIRILFSFLNSSNYGVHLIQFIFFSISVSLKSWISLIFFYFFTSQQIFLVSFTEARAEIVGPTVKYLTPGSTLKLICKVLQSTEATAYIFWYHDNRMINYDLDRGINVSSEAGKVKRKFSLSFLIRSTTFIHTTILISHSTLTLISDCRMK